jgi:hypothetical protein
MPRLLHGATVRLDTVEVADAILADRSGRRALAPAMVPSLPAFDFLFPALQDDPSNLLRKARATRDGLVALGKTMADPGDASDPGDSAIPAAYTYFGQFLDHDITLESLSGPPPDLFAEDLAPLGRAAIPARLKNLRTAALDLDSVYGAPAPRDPADPKKLKLGTVAPTGQGSKPLLRPPGKDDFNDLPREPRSPDVAHDRAALIGDPRNDENTIVAQLHLAFLRAHNALVDGGKGFSQARRILRQHYQHVVLRDFLPRIADPQVVEKVIEQGNTVFDPPAGATFMPIEFAFAAYRLGHSMARAAYNFNLNFNLSGEPGTVPADFGLLFTFSALSGELGDFETLPENWIVEWEHLVQAGRPFDKTRKIDTKVVEPLFHLRDVVGTELPGLSAHLAVRNLLRGYLVRLPTGQAVAQALGEAPLSKQEVEAAAASDAQAAVLEDAGFLRRTPLWYYLLAEARARTGGQRLGPVGSTILAETLVGLARRSEFPHR